jgi:hypothetical protein
MCAGHYSVATCRCSTGAGNEADGVVVSAALDFAHGPSDAGASISLVQPCMHAPPPQKGDCVGQEYIG